MFRNIYLSLTLLCLSLSGCSKVDPKVYDTDGPVAEGDMLVEGIGADAKNLNPVLLSEQTSGDVVNLVFNGLTRYNEKLEIVPCLAEKWKISPDGLIITYSLRKGVKFHDGVEFTSADVVFTYQCFVDPKINTPHGADYRDITSVKALDKYTVRITFRKPFAPALSKFEAILPKHLLEGKDFNKADFNRAPVGTGPYKFVEWKTDQQIVLEANPDYWEGKPRIARYVMRIIPDVAAEFMSLLKGEIDATGAWATGGISSEEYLKQSNTPKFTKYYKKFIADRLSYSYIGWNGARPMFKDKRVRQALTMGLDREAIVKNVSFGMSKVCSGPFPMASWAYDQKVQPWPYDPKRAKAQLELAGWKDTDGDGLLDKDLDGDGKREPFKFTLLLPQGGGAGEKIAVIAQQQLKEIGVQLEIRSLEWTTFLSQHVEKKDFDAIIMVWGMTPDPDSYTIWHSSQTGEHQYNFVSYKNPEVDRLLEAGVRTLDQKKRQAIYHRIHALIAEDQPYTFLLVATVKPAIHKRFKGYRELPLWDNTLLRAKDWYVPANQQKYPAPAR